MPELGDVAGYPGHQFQLAGGVADGKAAVAYPAHGAVWTDDPVFEIPRALGVRFQPRAYALAVLRVNGFEEGVRGAIEAFPGPAPDRFIRRADVDHLFDPGCAHPEDILYRFRHQAELRLWG